MTRRRKPDPLDAIRARVHERAEADPEAIEAELARVKEEASRLGADRLWSFGHLKKMESLVAWEAPAKQEREQTDRTALPLADVFRLQDLLQRRRDAGYPRRGDLTLDGIERTLDGTSITRWYVRQGRILFELGWDLSVSDPDGPTVSPGFVIWPEVEKARRLKR